MIIGNPRVNDDTEQVQFHTRADDRKRTTLAATNREGFLLVSQLVLDNHGREIEIAGVGGFGVVGADGADGG